MRNERLSPEIYRVLRRRLRREASETRPVFSESLDQRIRAAIDRRRAQPPWRRAAHRFGAWVVPLAAAALMAFAATTWQWADRSEPGSIATANRLPYPALTDVIQATLADWSPPVALNAELEAHLDQQAFSTILAARGAELQHDTLLAADALLDRLPIEVSFLVESD